MNAHSFRYAILLAGLVTTSGDVLADDWPRWMGPNMDGVWAEKGIIDRFDEEGPKIVWRQKVGGGYGGPSVAQGRVYVMDRTGDAKGAKGADRAISVART